MLEFKHERVGVSTGPEHWPGSRKKKYPRHAHVQVSNLTSSTAITLNLKQFNCIFIIYRVLALSSKNVLQNILRQTFFFFFLVICKCEQKCKKLEYYKKEDIVSPSGWGVGSRGSTLTFACYRCSDYCFYFLLVTNLEFRYFWGVEILSTVFMGMPI